MKRLRVLFLIICIIVCLAGCKVGTKSVENSSPSMESQDISSSTTKLEVGNLSSEEFMEHKVYYIPQEQQKQSYSVEKFKQFYFEYLKLNNITIETSPENDKTHMTKEDKLKYYTVYEITPKDVKKEIGCQIFKVNYTCETYVIYKAKVFPIGFGFGGLGIVNLTTCDFDGNGQKDLIYTFSFGSGLHRSQIGVFNFTKEQEEWLNFSQLNKDVMLEKISNKNYIVYIAELGAGTLDFIHVKLIRKERVASVRSINGKPEIIK